MKRLVFWGNALKTIQSFPEEIGQRIADQLRQLRKGNDPVNWRPMPDIGAGVIEIKITSKTGQFRVFYVAKFEEAIYILHAFQKKSQKTAKKDVENGRRKYKELIQYRQSQ